MPQASETAERADRRLPALRDNERLTRAAEAYSAKMVRRRFFAHVCPEGSTLKSRIRAAKYLNKSIRDYSLGENLAWASQQIATPRKMVNLWMKSPPHRQNILTKDFRDQAVSAVWSAGNVGGAYANSGGPFLLYTNQFGARL